MKPGLQNKPPIRPVQQPFTPRKTPTEEELNMTSKDTEKFPTSSLLSRDRAARRSLSGVPLTCLFETKFKHFKKFQNIQRETRGLNFLLGPSSRAIYRSSMPVTPISTPMFSRPLPFTEQTLHNRILETQAAQQMYQPSAIDSFRIQEEPESSSPDIEATKQ